MKYRPYRLNMEKVTKIVRKLKPIKLPKIKNLNTMQKAIKWTYHNSMAKLSDMDSVIHAEELHWLNTGRTVYFPENLEMAENIINGSYKIKTEDALYDGPESFIINLPTGLAFNDNDEGSGLLVTIMPHDDRANKIIKEFTDWIDVPEANVIVKGDQGKFTIAITYQNIFNSDEYSRIVLPSFGAIAYLCTDDLDDYIKNMSYGDNFNYSNHFKLNREEYAYQFEMIRLVCGFLVYKKALPDRVINGLPGINHKEVETPITKGQKHYVVKNPRGSKEVSGHYRSWHFRQLMAERYYHGEHKNKPVGSRVVFVSDSYVVQDVDVKTVLAK